MHAILQCVAIPFIDVGDIATDGVGILLTVKCTDCEDDVAFGLRLLDVEVEVGTLPSRKIALNRFSMSSRLVRIGPGPASTPSGANIATMAVTSLALNAFA